MGGLELQKYEDEIDVDENGNEIIYDEGMDYMIVARNTVKEYVPKIGDSLKTRLGRIYDDKTESLKSSLLAANTSSTIVLLFDNISKNYRKMHALSDNDVYDLERKLIEESDEELIALSQLYADNSDTNWKLDIIKALCTEYLHTTVDEMSLIDLVSQS